MWVGAITRISYIGSGLANRRHSASENLVTVVLLMLQIKMPLRKEMDDGSSSDVIAAMLDSDH